MSLVVVVPLIEFHALFHLLDSCPHLVQSSVTMTTFIVFGLLMLLRLFEGVESGLHVGLIFGHCGQRENRCHDQS